MPRPPLFPGLLLAGLLLGASAALPPEPEAAPVPEPAGIAAMLGSLLPCIEALDLDPPELLDATDLAILHGLWEPSP